MKPLTEKDIKEKIEKIKKDRDAYVLQVQQQMAAFQGAIQAYELLLAPPEETEDAVPADG